MSDWGRPPADPSLEWEYISNQVLATNSALTSFSGFSTNYRRFMLDFYVVSQQSVGASAKLVLNADGSSGNIHYQVALSQFEMNALTNDYGVLTSDNVLISGVALGGLCGAGWAFIEKPSALLNGRFIVRQVSERSLVAIQAEQRDGEWLNTTELIYQIDIVGSVGAGTRFVLSGARESL